jgi:hypothetical protein
MIKTSLAGAKPGPTRTPKSQLLLGIAIAETEDRCEAHMKSGSGVSKMSDINPEVSSACCKQRTFPDGLFWISYLLTSIALFLAPGVAIAVGIPMIFMSVMIALAPDTLQRGMMSVAQAVRCLSLFAPHKIMPEADFSGQRRPIAA